MTVLIVKDKNTRLIIPRVQYKPQNRQCYESRQTNCNDDRHGVHPYKAPPIHLDQKCDLRAIGADGVNLFNTHGVAAADANIRLR
jgi:hypothetical protein